jgi:plastocyanin
MNNGVNTPPPIGGISVTNNMFSPGTKTVAVGASVQWAWNTCTGDAYNGQTCVQHSVTFDDGSASSALQDQGTFNKTFNTAGTFTYHCSVHGAAMTGSITVQ